MKQFLERVFGISLFLGAMAAVFCVFSAINLGNPIYILIGLVLGFLGFVLCCLHIVGVQRYEVKQAAVPLLLLSLLLNSVPLIYMIMVVMRSKQ